MMDGRGGCCIARYAGGGGGAYDDTRKMERVMLKFRPIAPKPVSTGSGSVFGSSSSDNSNNNNNKTSSGETTTYVKAGRGKRKYNTSTKTTKRRYTGGRKRVRLSTSHSLDEKRDECSGVTTATTLSLLPESPSTAGIKTPTSRSAPMWLSFNSNNNNTNNNAAVNNNIQINNNRHYFSNVRVRGGRVVGSGVTVERVTDTWVNGEGLGRTDEERVRNLEYDTCPGFITEGYENRVQWTNRAYKKMVFGDNQEVEEGNDEVVVWVVMKEKLLMGNCKAFTCRVRVQNTCTKENRVLPCDVWRMDGGGFAWRLDVKAALSLGR